MNPRHEPRPRSLTTIGHLLAICLIGCALAACDDGEEGDGDADADADGGADGDGDGDADSDSDGDGDSDADGDTEVDADEDSDGDGDVAPPVALGINLTDVAGWSDELVDMGRTTRAFMAIGGGDVAVDEHGWPTTDAATVVFDRRPYSAWTGAIDDPEAFSPDMSGTYLVSFTGDASVDETESEEVYVENVVYDAGTNRTTCDLVVSAAADEWSNVAVLELTGTTGGIRDLRITRPGYAHDTTQIFHQPFLDALRHASFEAVGFAGWTRPSDSNPAYPETTEWADRASMDDATWESNTSGHEQGMPWEMVVALANELGRDIWINVPVAASDDYVTELATLLESTLDSSINIYVEYSSHVWHGGLTQKAWNDFHAADEGLTAVQAYARRTVEIGRLFAAVFGADAINSRVRVVDAWVLGGDRPDYAFVEQMELVEDEFGPPADEIYAIAGGAFSYALEAPADATQEELLATLADYSDGRVAALELVQLVADEYALPGGVLAYEGGPDLGGGAPSSAATRILAARSAAMGDFITHDLDDNWFARGGGLFMFSVLCSPYSRFRTFGLTDDINDPDRNSQFAAVRRLLGDL